mmetsp:Transcript_61495/g.146686  ORF Transcript_61495/g.146686 Transcript_61495/m.146686 type:complete len:83 (+) Transcript_61495:409-657(+)
MTLYSSFGSYGVAACYAIKAFCFVNTCMHRAPRLCPSCMRWRWASFVAVVLRRLTWGLLHETLDSTPAAELKSSPMQGLFAQ